ncbi:hypothetical protein BHE74_00016769 [Ensete ventricosum]|nr:hypothetical protein BHE74_00016769 [Ensete ventricosum]
MVAVQAGGFDMLLLDSLYEDSARRRQQMAAAYCGGLDANPFDLRDPFAMSNSIAPPPSVQMVLMAHQQQLQQQYYSPQQQQQFYQPQYPPPQQRSSANPFGDPFVGFPPSAAPQGNQYLL